MRDGKAAGQETPLLSTKLRPPAARARQVVRPHLIEHLDRGLSARLVLVSAPAGFGKTTLLCEWLAHSSAKAAWLSLDEADNDHVRFLRYLVASLRRVAPGVGEEAVAMLQPLDGPPLESALTTLLNDLSALPDELVIVLDDYHLIQSTPVHRAVAFLLDSLPPNAHLMIATRADPPLPLPRLRSRGDLAEIRADALRFTLEEAERFLTQTMGLTLSTEDAASLEARTEGWIAGLKMAALSLQGRADASDFIRAFGGSHRYILDFLAEEVLGRLSADVQTFLLQTSILGRLSGPLCDAVTGRTDGNATLKTLERANLFLVPLDDERRWYRYHHLFGDLLRSRLLEAQPEGVAVLHGRAADWLSQNGMTAEAMGHALSARDFDRAARLIEQTWFELAQAGETRILVGWLEALPKQMVRRSPQLSLCLAWTFLQRGRVEAMEPHLDDAEKSLAEQLASGEATGQEDERRALAMANVYTLRAFVAFQRGDSARAMDLGERALTTAGESPLHPRGVACLILGAAYRLSGDLTRAGQTYREAESACWSAGNTFGAVVAAHSVAGVQRWRGRLRDSSETCLATLRLCGERGVSRLPAVGMVHLALAEVMLEWDYLDAARHHIEQGLELSERGGYFDTGGIVSARLKLATGDLPGALASIEKARSSTRRRDSWMADAEMAAYRARLLVAGGHLAEASRWADEVSHRQVALPWHVAEAQAIAASRIRIAEGRLGEAVGVLTPCLEGAEAGGRAGTVVQALALRSLALDGQGKRAEATADLTRALSLAQPEGYVRVFVEEGLAMVRLLQGIRRKLKPADPAKSYVARLLAAAGGEAKAGVALAGSGTQSTAEPEAIGGLPEPLTPREMEVLRLIAQGLKTADIAERLVVTPGTVKVHTHSILSKLDAQNRLFAIVRAQELGLL